MSAAVRRVNNCQTRRASAMSSGIQARGRRVALAVPVCVLRLNTVSRSRTAPA